MTGALPPIPTHVMGSHGFPGWFWTALDKIKAGEYGQTDVKETFDDATQLAIRDQERAGVDVVCDGEMRRFFFVQTFYGKMDGLEEIEPLRKTGLYAYDSVPRYRPVGKVVVPKGLGTVEEFRYLRTQTDKPVDALAALVKQAGFTQESFEKCLTDQKLLDGVLAIKNQGEKEFKVDSTPTFFINGNKYSGNMSIEEFDKIISPLVGN